MRNSSSSPEVSTKPALAVILAAGEGSRLASEGDARAKPTVRILGLSLGERTLLACMDAGIQRFLIVLGHEADRVRVHFERIAEARGCEVSFVEAPDWRLGNGASALAAASVSESPFLLTMVDHLVDPQIIRVVSSATLQSGEIGLGVDRDGARLAPVGRIFDLDDATKLVLDGDRIEKIGKTLEDWDAADTGVFICTRSLFEALEEAAAGGRHGLSDGVAIIAKRGALRAIDVTGLDWIDVDTPEAWREARKRMISKISGKSSDGYISRHLNRRVSKWISVWLSSTPVTPNQITVVSFSMALGGVVLTIAGGFLLQVSSIVDGCDGEIARLKHWASKRGAWLDTVLDRYADAAVTIAITFAYARDHIGALVWIGGMIALSGFVLVSYTTKEYELRHGTPYPEDFLSGMKRRDLRLLGIALGAACGIPYLALIVLGALSHLCVFGVLVRGWRYSAQSER